MCDAKPAGSGNVLTTPSGVPYYADNKAQRAGETKAMGPGAGETTQPPPGEQPPFDPTDCTTYTDAQWDTGCSKFFKFANMNRKPQGGSVPEAQVACNWQKLCQNILDPIKERFPGVSISSGFRPSAYDRELGGSGNGDHTYGKAADIQLLGAGREEGAKQLFKFIGSSGLPYSQLIFEGGWVHVAYQGSSPASVAVLVTRNGKAPYQNGGGRGGSTLPPDLRWA